MKNKYINNNNRKKRFIFTISETVKKYIFYLIFILISAVTAAVIVLVNLMIITIIISIISAFSIAFSNYATVSLIFIYIENLVYSLICSPAYSLI